MNNFHRATEKIYNNIFTTINNIAIYEIMKNIIEAEIIFFFKNTQVYRIIYEI